MLKLTLYPGAFGEPSASPFCVKALCLLKWADLPYEVEETNDPRKAPKSKLPVLQDGATVVPDSDQIRDYLESKTGIDFDEGLTAEQRATGRALIRMLEEHVYFAIVHDRWIDDENWALIRSNFFSEVPAIVRPLVTGQIRKQVVGQLKGQGIGRHTAAERFTRVTKDIAAVAALLGDKPFLFGESPAAADITAVTMLRAGIATPIATELSRFIEKQTGLCDYLERGREALYP